MLKHTFKIIWNQKQKYTGIFIEQILVFIILMLCITTFSETIKQYISPGTLDTQNTFYLDFGSKIDYSSRQKMYQRLNNLMEKVKTFPMVTATSKTTEFTPYLNNGKNLAKDSLMIDGRKVLVYLKTSDPGGFEVFKPTLDAGTWLGNDRREDGSYPAVISRQLAETMGWSNALGKQILYKTRTFTIVGIISGIKHTPLQKSLPMLIAPEHIEEAPRRDHSIRIKEGEENGFVSLLHKEFKKAFPEKEITPLIVHVDQWKAAQIFDTLFSFSFVAIPTCFLLIFAFIGTFGLFWLYSQKRRKEYALRMALGSTTHRLMGFVIREGCIITLCSTLPGLLLFFLVYDLTPVNLMALLLTLIIIIVFSITSVWLPAYQVSKINPAETLHYE